MSRLTGAVDSALRPVILIRVSGTRVSFPAWIDLGFEGDLVVHRPHIGRLGVEWTPRRIRTRLADGTTVMMPVGRLPVRMLGRARRATVLLSDEPDPARDEASGAPLALIGLGLLRGARLTVDLAPGGSVTVERPIPRERA